MRGKPTPGTAVLFLAGTLSCGTVISPRSPDPGPNGQGHDVSDRKVPHGEAPLTMIEREQAGLVRKKSVQRCLHGVVATTGPVGGPRRDIPVCVRIEGHDAGQTKTDERGQYRWCVDRREPSLAEGFLADLFWGDDPSTFRDRAVRVEVSLCGVPGGTTSGSEWFTADPLRMDLFVTR